MLAGLSTQPDSPESQAPRVLTTLMDPQLDQIIESLLFASPEPIESKEIARLVRNVAKRRAADEAEAEAAEAEGSEYEDDEPFSEDAVDESAEAASDHIEEAQEDAEEVEGAEDAEDAEDSEAEEDEEMPVDLIKLSAAEVAKAIDKLNTYYENTGRAFAVVSRPNGWKLYSRPEFSPWLRELFPVKRSARLSPPALETLAIIAYRQPLTRAAIEAVRGVAVDGVVNTLVERGLIHIAGRADLPGRPLLYETTPLFFEHFNIRTIDDLPNAAELRQVKLPEPESETAEGDEEEESAEQEELDLAEEAEEEEKKTTSSEDEPKDTPEEEGDSEDPAGEEE